METKMYQNLSILIVEDEVETLEQLRDFLSLYFGFVYCAKTGYEGLECVDKYHPDVIVSDIEMPNLNGMEMLKEVKKMSANSIFIFTTAYSDTKYLLDAIDCKVDAYIIKPIGIDTLLDKINHVLKDRIVMNQLNSVLLNSVSNLKILHSELSKREYEVFLDIAKGIKPNNIAQKYGLKPKTVSTYRKRILEKMCLNSNAEIIKYAIVHNLV